jgi:hypothetical protein
MYFYHADALAFGGTMVRPIPEMIESLAACSLPAMGGIGSARSSKYTYKDLISFDSAQTNLMGGIEVTGSGEQLNTTRVSVVIEGLNIMHMVTADRIALRLVATHKPGDPEPSIITTGCHYDGLKIAGHEVKLTCDHGLYSELPTYAHFKTVWEASGEMEADSPKARLHNSLMGKSIPQAPTGDDPQHLRDIYKGFQSQHKSIAENGKPVLGQTVLSSFVSSVEKINATEIDTWGPIIRVPQFGTIYLGEVIVSPSQRRVSMLRVEMGSPDLATFTGPTGTSNGTGFP